MSDDKNFDPWSNPPPPPKKKPRAGGNPPPPPPGGPRRDEPDMDEMLKKFRQNTQNFFGGGDDGNKRLALIGAAVLIGLWLMFSCIFFVSSGEKAVVLRLGEYQRTVEAGPHFKLPLPLEEKFIRNVEKPNIISIGEGDAENLVVTGDENIVDVEFVVLWKIKNLEYFLFGITKQNETAKNAAESAMREVIGSKNMASVLGEDKGRSKMGFEVQELLQKMLDNYKSGIQVVGVELKKIDVPRQVIEAQIDVQNAKTEQERVKNQAEAYRNDILPRAGGDAAKMIEDSEAYKQSVVAKAKGDASRFMAVYEQYKNAKEVTKSRIYLETMQEVMGKMDKVIIDDNSRVLPYLPLNSLKLGNKEVKNAE